MNDVDMIQEHMEVIGSDGEHVGTVDKVEGTMIKLTKNDPQANGEHHWLATTWISRVDEHVHLKISARDAMAQWVNRQTMESPEWEENVMANPADIGSDIGGLPAEKSIGKDI
jgi:hypothetical protein